MNEKGEKNIMKIRFLAFYFMFSYLVYSFIKN